MRKTHLLSLLFLVPGCHSDESVITMHSRPLPSYGQGILQSVGNNHFSSEPRSMLQWYLHSWPASNYARFPLTMDQEHPKTRLQRVDERVYWDFGRFKPNIASLKCHGHMPESISIQHDSGSKVPFIIHDTQVDVRHPDLNGQVEVQNSTLKPENHGTHIAGLLTGKSDANGIQGLSPKSQIYSFGLTPSHDKHGNILVESKQVLKQLSAIKNKLQELPDLNNSSVKAIVVLGYGFFFSGEETKEEQALKQQFTKKLAEIVKEKVLVFVPDGNGQTEEKNRVYPADIVPYLQKVKNAQGTAFRVRASDMCSRESWFTRKSIARSSSVDILAPGERIYSSFVNQDYGFLSGSSMATAIAAGTFAQFVTQFPEIKPKQIRSELKKGLWARRVLNWQKLRRIGENQLAFED